MGIIYAVTNQKGGTGKTTAALNLAYGLALQNKKVLLLDFDPQSSLTILLGTDEPDILENTIGKLMGIVMVDGEYDINDYILTKGSVDYIPSNIGLSSMERQLINATSREYFLQDILDKIRDDYDYIIIDNSPSLGLLTVNALTAADKVVIPILTDFLSLKGLELLMDSFKSITKRLNPNLIIDGILLNQYNPNLKNSKNIESRLVGGLRVYEAKIPGSVKAKEASAAQEDIFTFCPSNPVAKAYNLLALEIINSNN